MAPRDHVRDRTPAADVVRRGHIGRIVLASILSGMLSALVLAVLVLGGADEPVSTGVVLLAFAGGWGLLGWLSERRTDQPQRWTIVPAAVMAVLGLAHLLLRPTDPALSAFGWVWPPLLVVLVVWMVGQARRSLHSWSRPVLLYPVFVALLLAAIGGGVERVAETRTYSMPGQLVDVGGHKLHISCTGSGGPTVVLEAGLGEPAVMMASRIQPAVAIGTTVCVYDRAGRGFSEPATEQQDGLTIATDLHTLLVRAHIPGPYVLAGHSSGGVYVKVFAARYPADVAGMVLIDSQPSDAIDKLPGFAGFYNGFRRASGLAPSLARLGALRLFYATAVAGLPPRPRAEERADWSTARHYRSLREEVLGLKAALTQSQELTSLGDKPLVVLTAAKDAQAGWLPLQDEMVGLSSNAVHRVARNATHTSLTEDESDASLSSQAILDVVAAVRSGTPLAQ